MSLRAALLTLALSAGPLFSGLFAASPVRAVTPRYPDRFPVLYAGGGQVYLLWHADEGARVGAAVELVGPDGLASDTLFVEWTRDAITRLGHAARGNHLDEVGTDWWGRPLAIHMAAPPSGTLTVPLFAQPATLDPALVTSLAEKQVVAQIFEGLVRFDAHLAPQPALAESYTNKGRVWTFRLREGARFHDGRAVRAKDVVASLQRALDPGTHAPRSGGLADAIASLAESDSLTVKITGSRDRAPLLAELASPAAFIVPVDLATGLAKAPVGSGPFRFVRMDDAGVALAAAPGRMGGVDTLVFRRVDGPDDAALDFELGRLDVVSARESDERKLMAIAGETPSKVEQDEAATYYIGMNTRQAWLARRANRRSLAASIDRALAVRVLVPGRGALAASLLPPAFNGPALAESAWRPPAAEALAWPEPPPAAGLAFWVPDGSATGVRVAEFVQAGLARRGLKVRIVTKPWSEFERGVTAGEADLFYLSWFADGPDPVAFVASMVESSRKGAAGNRTFYASRDVDAALARARAATTEDRARAALLDAERVALADAPLIPLFHSVNVTLVKPWVTGFVLDPLGAPRYDAVEVHRGR
jgi:ABC-type transport system substrate-binding protein